VKEVYELPTKNVTKSVSISAENSFGSTKNIEITCSSLQNDEPTIHNESVNSSSGSLYNSNLSAVAADLWRGHTGILHSSLTGFEEYTYELEGHGQPANETSYVDINIFKQILEKPDLNSV